MRKITIEPVTRIEGHAKITIHLGEDGNVARTQFHVTQVRGFEKFTEGPAVLRDARDHGANLRHLPDQPPAGLGESLRRDHGGADSARRGCCIREAIHCGQIVQSHALSFFHLSAPDLLLGMDSDPAKRNVLGLAEKYPEIARDGIALRKFGQRVIERLAGERVHPSGIVPGGVQSPLEAADRDEILKELPEARAIARRTLDAVQKHLDGFADEIAKFGTMPTMYAGLVDAEGDLQLYDGRIRFKTAAGQMAAEIEAAQYAELYRRSLAARFLPEGAVL